MARKPAPVYAPVAPTAAGLAPADLWAEGALTVREAAAFLARSYSAMKELVRDKKVVTKKDGKLRLVSRRSCVLYLANLPES